MNSSNSSGVFEFKPTSKVRRFLSNQFGIALTILGAVIVTLIVLAIIILSLGKAPDLILNRFLTGSLGDANGRADVIMAALPMLMCASGLLLTFTAGLWNIGVEGQVVMGAIFATVIARSVTADSPALIAIVAELIMAMIGGALWAGLTAILKTKANINEIFGGVALNFISTNVLISLVNGPWRVGTTPQTAPFLPPALIPRLEGTRLSPGWIFVALLGFAAVFMVLRGTRWGLHLRAMGKSQTSAYLLGVRTERNVLLSMMACGAMAGLAGAFQVLATRGRLVPGVSGGLGFMGVLIVMLVNYRPSLVPFVALIFAIVPIGSLKLSTSFDAKVQIDAALGNVIQGAMVLAVLLAGGLRARLIAGKKEEPPPPTTTMMIKTVK